MKKLGSKGFTLVELLATLVILSIVMGIGGLTITNIINKSKEKEYKLLIKEVKNAINEYYIECMDPPKDSDGNNIIGCPLKDNGYYSIRLGDLVEFGYLSGETNGLYNPMNDYEISECQIKYKVINGGVIVEAITSEICPSIDDYINN